MWLQKKKKILDKVVNKDFYNNFHAFIMGIVFIKHANDTVFAVISQFYT